VVWVWSTIGLLRTDDQQTRLATLGTLTLAVLAVVAVYGPGSVLTGQQVLLGVDHVDLHARRMAFAREALWGAKHALPGWYPRELLGTPFWSNTQNFPLLPTRLAVFLAFQPDVAFSAGAILAAVLSLVFTWLFARRLGMSSLAAVVAGFTFACSLLRFAGDGRTPASAESVPVAAIAALVDRPGGPPARTIQLSVCVEKVAGVGSGQWVSGPGWPPSARHLFTGHSDGLCVGDGQPRAGGAVQLGVTARRGLRQRGAGADDAAGRPKRGPISTEARAATTRARVQPG